MCGGTVVPTANIFVFKQLRRFLRIWFESSPESNPYDLVAKAVFTHEGGWTRKIEMFYACGVLGNDHKRLMCYTTARLGPLPGWCMNFGFDTNELPNPESITSQWENYLNDRMGWNHMVCARGWKNNAFAINSYSGFSGSYELTTTRNGPSGYEEIRNDVDSDISKPHLCEERNTYNRFKYVEPGSGQEPGDGPDQYGMGGFFGHFSVRFNSYGPFSQNCGCGYHPDSLKCAFRCFRDFWAKDRFMFDMAVDTGRVRNGTGYCLRTKDYKNFVFFVENDSRVEIDLGGMPGSRRVIVVDARNKYSEISKGSMSAGWRTIDFGYASDWAITVEDFDNETALAGKRRRI